MVNFSKLEGATREPNFLDENISPCFLSVFQDFEEFPSPSNMDGICTESEWEKVNFTKYFPEYFNKNSKMLCDVNIVFFQQHNFPN